MSDLETVVQLSERVTESLDALKNSFETIKQNVSSELEKLLTSKTADRYKDAVIGMVVYTDGGCKDPGYGGVGVHGYVYIDVEPKTGHGCKQRVTNIGYVDKNATLPIDENVKVTADGYVGTDSLTKYIRDVTVLTYFDAVGSIHLQSTNNECELLAFQYVLEIAKTLNIKKLNVFLDSEYVLNGVTEWRFNWMSNGWKNSSNVPISNIDLWKYISNELDNVVSDIDIGLEWVKGHSGVLGNECADVLASSGVAMAMKGATTAKLIATPSKTYWTYRYLPNNYLLDGRWYFTINTPTHVNYSDCEYSVYHLGNHSVEDELVGKKLSDTGYSVVLVPKPDPILEEVRGFLKQNSHGDLGGVYLARLDYIFNGVRATNLLNWGRDALSYFGKNRDCRTPDKTPIVKHLIPPRLSFKAVAVLDGFQTTLMEFMSKHPNYTETDITSLIYETNCVKDKPFVSVKLPDDPSFSAECHCTLRSGELLKQNITLTYGIDIPKRRTLSKLAAQNPKVSVITWLESDSAYR